MKTPLVVALSLSLLSLTGAAHATKKTYSAVMTGEGEVPAVDTEGAGLAILTVDDTNKTICGTITYAGLSGDPNSMHIHEGDATVASGDIVQAITVGASPLKVNITNVGSDKLTKIFTGATYVNIHTANHGGGEIRGQLAEGGTVQLCDGEKPDPGTPPTQPDGGGSGGTDAGATGTDGGNGASTVRTDAGTTPTGSGGGGDDGGCSATGSIPGNGLAMVGIAFGLTTLARVRRRRAR